MLFRVALLHRGHSSKLMIGVLDPRDYFFRLVITNATIITTGITSSAPRIARMMISSRGPIPNMIGCLLRMNDGREFDHIILGC